MRIIVFTLLVASAASTAEVPRLPNSGVMSSARCVSIAASPDDQVAPTPHVAPGTPPVLSFRYFEGQLHYRFGNMDLMFDDAGH